MRLDKRYAPVHSATVAYPEYRDLIVAVTSAGPSCGVALDDELDSRVLRLDMTALMLMLGPCEIYNEVGAIL